MDSYDEPEFLSTRIIEGPLDVHPTKNAIVVHYSVDARVLSEDFHTMGADLKQCRKIINITNLTTGVNIPSLARHIVTQTPLIQPQRVTELEQLLVYLISRKQSSEIMEASSKEIEKQLEDSQKEVKETASMMDVEDYLESLYESLPEKIRGTALLLQLSRNPDNLQELGSNESMFLALVRVLRDDWKKSIELTTNIVYIFFCFSTFSDFHPILLNHKIGSLCMTVVQHELKRHETLLEDLETKKKDVWAKKVTKRDYEKSKKRLSVIFEKQESLLKVCLYLLLNLAESPAVEQKMRNKGIIKQLVQLLSRENQELLILVVSFLKKLSIYGENKDEMAKEDLLPKLLKLIPCDNDILINVTLRLLMNLSFDPTLREEMTNLGFLPKLVALLSNETHKFFVLFVLYHISVDEKGRAAFAYTECVPMVMKFMLETDDHPEPELMGLAVNLALYPINAQIMCQGPGLKLLMNKALHLRDSLMMKLIRNISKHEGEIKNLFLDYIAPLGEIVRTSAKDDDILVEVVGILGNIQIAELDYYKVMTELKLLEPMLSLLKEGQMKDDMILALVAAFGTFAADSGCALSFAKAGLPQILIDILKGKQDDDGIVFQIANTFQKMLLNPKTSDLIMKTEAPDYFIELMNDKNTQIGRLSSLVVTAMATHCPDFSERVKAERFKLFNCQWVEMATGRAVFEEEEETEDEDYMDPYFLHNATDLYGANFFDDLAAGNLTNGDGLLVQDGRETPLPHPLYTSPVAMEYGQGESLRTDELTLSYADRRGDLFSPTPMGEVPDYEEHPAFMMMQGIEPKVLTARPPSRLNF